MSISFLTHPLLELLHNKLFMIGSIISFSTSSTVCKLGNEELTEARIQQPYSGTGAIAMLLQDKKFPHMYKRTGYAGGPLSDVGNFLVKINSTDIYTLNLPTLTKITCK